MLRPLYENQNIISEGRIKTILKKSDDGFKSVAIWDNEATPPCVGETWTLVSETEPTMYVGTIIAITENYIFCE